MINGEPEESSEHESDYVQDSDSESDDSIDDRTPDPNPPALNTGNDNDGSDDDSDADSDDGGSDDDRGASGDKIPAQSSTKLTTDDRRQLERLQGTFDDMVTTFSKRRNIPPARAFRHLGTRVKYGRGPSAWSGFQIYFKEICGQKPKDMRTLILLLPLDNFV